MTEAEWESCADPEQMIQFLFGRVGTSERKYRLVACACCRHVWESLTDPRSRRAVEIAEQFADELVSREDFEAAAIEARKMTDAAARATWTDTEPDVARDWTQWTAFAAAGHAARRVAEATKGPPEVVASTADAAWKRERAWQAWLVREINGNPFRPLGLDRRILTPTVTAIARSIYDERRFEDMPILADALEDAGCDNADILHHCRQPGEHMRGCWAVDLLLGR